MSINPVHSNYPQKTVDRFWSKVSVGDECWEWDAARFSNGYGQFYLEGKSRLAHRFSYEVSVGPIPIGLVLDHLCNNKPCVRPDHLEPVTQGENTARGYERRAATACRRGHPFSEENTYLRTRSDGVVVRVCRPCRRKHRAIWEAKRSKSSA